MAAPPPAVTVLPQARAVAWEAAETVARAGEAAVARKGSFTIALSGGTTPKAVFAILAEEPYRARVPWEKTHFFWGDERHCPPTHEDSNYRMACEAMLSRVSVPPGAVHRIHGELADAAQAAAEYEDELRTHFRTAAGAFPRFDLVLLGLGADAHTASLFPGTDAVRERERLVVAPWVEKLKTHRITLTPPVFNAAAAVLFLVAEKDKAEAVRAVLDAPEDVDRYPAQAIRPGRGTLRFLLDSDAASLL